MALCGALFDLVNNKVDIVGDLGDEYNVGPAGYTGVEGEPAGLVTP